MISLTFPLFEVICSDLGNSDGKTGTADFVGCLAGATDVSLDVDIDAEAVADAAALLALVENSEFTILCGFLPKADMATVLLYCFFGAWNMLLSLLLMLAPVPVFALALALALAVEFEFEFECLAMTLAIESEIICFCDNFDEAVLARAWDF